MKKCFLCSSIIMVILLAYNIVLGEDFVRIGLVDMQRCLNESKEGQKAVKLLKKKDDVLKRQLDTKQKELLELRRELEKQAMMLSMDAQEDKRRLIERKTRELEYLYKDLNEEMRRSQKREEKRILKEVGKIIEKIGSEENYTFIIEKRAGAVLYSVNSVDITEKVIRAYDQMKEESKK